MYEEIFQTTNRPFRATPDIQFYFPFESMEQTRQTVLRAVRRAEGPVAVMGGVGLGKSLLAAMLAEDLADRFDVVRLHATRLCSRRAMLQNILFELQLPYRDLSEGELRLSLMERMEPSPAHAAEGLALIVDEAQTLPTKLLEELRLITNFARQGQSRARLVLLGSMHLEETLALPEMSSFNQRLAARCFLQPMNRIQTADFVRHQFTCAQVDPKQVITRDALENVYIASEGIPRLVNQVMDHALILAIAGDQYPISASLIQEAWADLQQLPLSWSQPEVAESTPVEFGSIDDMDQDFELEPEGLDELEAATPPNLDWPAPSDLEDFGPTSPRAPLAAPTAESKKNLPRVVFDASTMFGKKANVSATNSSASVTPSQSAPIVPGTPSSRPLSANDRPVDNRPGSDQDMFIFNDEPVSQTSPTEDSTMVRNMFAAWNPPAETYTYEFDIPRSSLTQSDAQQTDEYQLADSDLSSYEASDYQLAAWPEEMNLHMQPVPMPLARQTEPASEDPFGEDFDEEFAIESVDVRRWQARQMQRQIEEQTNQSQPHFSPQPVASGYDLSDSQPLVVQPNYTDEMPFVEMTASGTVDEQVVAEIEDLISQLNFSAFSVEMDSVEQISPDCIRQAAVAAQYNAPSTNGSQQINAQRESQHERAVVLQMRKAETSGATHASLDDDRDLLIIEEEVPASMRHPAPVPPAPTPHTMSYPDLFQQLRG